MHQAGPNKPIYNDAWKQNPYIMMHGNTKIKL